MRSYSTRAARGAIPFEVDGVTYMAKPVLEMQAKRDLSMLDFQIEQAFRDLRKEAKDRADALEPGDLDGFALVSDFVLEGEQRIREMVVQACGIMVEPVSQDAFVAGAGDWDDFTLYEIYADLRKQATSADEVMTKDRPTRP